MTTSATAVVVLWAAAAAAAADVRSNDFYGRLGFGPGAAGDRDTCSPKVFVRNLLGLRLNPPPSLSLSRVNTQLLARQPPFPVNIKT